MDFLTALSWETQTDPFHNNGKGGRKFWKKEEGEGIELAGKERKNSLKKKKKALGTGH